MLRSFGTGTRLTAAFGLILLLFSSLLVVGAMGGRASTSQLMKTLQRVSASQATAVELQAALLEHAIAIRNMALQTELNAIHEQKRFAEARQGQFVKLLDALIAGAENDEERKLLAQLAAISNSTKAYVAQAVGLAAAMSTDEATTFITGKIDPLLEQSKGHIQRLLAMKRTDADGAYLLAEAEQKRLQLVLLVAALAVVSLAAAFAWRLASSITVPLQAAVRATAEVAAGNLLVQLDTRGNDEAAALMRGLATMRDSLAGMVNNVRLGAESIACASGEIARGNQDLSDRTDNQASGLQETSATMGDLDSTVRQNADHSAQANQLALSASKVASRGGEVVGEVVSVMRGINEASRRIAEITGVIDGIAFQTNILALNAAVESARAGEHGRGFAVVAAEVRTLAQRSAASAREIKTLIQDSVGRVDAGTQLADRAGQTMQEIVESILGVTAIMSDLISSSARQTQHVSQVVHTVSEMDHATQQNAALVEQSAAAAASLKSQAQVLVDAVSVFRISASRAG